MNVAEAIANYQHQAISDTSLLQLVVGKGGEKLDIPLNEAIRLEYPELRRLMGKQSATKLAAVFELARRAMAPRKREVKLTRPEDVYAYCRPRMAHRTTEEFRVLLLDTKHRLIRDAQVAVGGLTSCAISPRDVFAPVIREDAPCVIFVHNHPSGDPTPSRDDIALTERLAEGARNLGIQLLDHVVIADTGYASLSEMGKM